MLIFVCKDVQHFLEISKSVFSSPLLGKKLISQADFFWKFYVKITTNLLRLSKFHQRHPDFNERVLLKAGIDFQIQTMDYTLLTH